MKVQTLCQNGALLEIETEIFKFWSAHFCLTFICNIFMLSSIQYETICGNLMYPIKTSLV